MVTRKYVHWVLFAARFPYLCKFYDRVRKCTLVWASALVCGRTMTWCISDILPASVHTSLVRLFMVTQGVEFRLRMLFHPYLQIYHYYCCHCHQPLPGPSNLFIYISISLFLSLLFAHSLLVYHKLHLLLSMWYFACSYNINNVWDAFILTIFSQIFMLLWIAWHRALGCVQE